MGIYNEGYANLIYERSLYNLDITLRDTKHFLESITGEDGSLVLNESVGETIKNLWEGIKKICKKVIDFLKSIPGKLKEIFSKIVDKIKGKDEEIEEKEKAPEYIFENKEYSKDIYNYYAMCADLFDRGNFMFDDSAAGYKAFVGNGLQDSIDRFEQHYGDAINRNRFHKCKTKQELEQYIASDDYKNIYKKSDADAEHLIKYMDIYKPSNLSDLIKKAGEYQTHWEKIGKNVDDMFKDDINYTGDLLSTLSSSKASEDKIKEAGLDPESLRKYKKFITYSAEACQTVVKQAFAYVGKATTQYNELQTFVVSCYKKNPDYKEATPAPATT
jgi:hypothetical protein